MGIIHDNFRKVITPGVEGTENVGNATVTISNLFFLKMRF